MLDFRHSVTNKCPQVPDTMPGDGNSLVVNHYYHLCGVHYSSGLIVWLGSYRERVDIKRAQAEKQRCPWADSREQKTHHGNGCHQKGRN